MPEPSEQRLYLQLCIGVSDIQLGLSGRRMSPSMSSDAPRFPRNIHTRGHTGRADGGIFRSYDIRNNVMVAGLG